MEDTTRPFLKAIFVFNQVFGIAAPLVISKLGFGEGIDLQVLIMFNCILNLFINFAPAIVVERTIWRELRPKDFSWAMLCGVVGAGQQILSVINFGLVPANTSSTVAIAVPIAVVFLDSISSLLSRKKLSIGIVAVRKGVAVLIWSCAALVSHPNIYQGPVIFRLRHHQDSDDVIATAPTPAPVPVSWATTIGNLALCFAGSAPIATWCTNAIKEKKITPKLSYSFSISTLNYLFGMILAAMYAMYCDWNKDSFELVSFTTLKVVEYIMILISAGLTAGSTWLVQQKGPSYAAPFAYIYLIIEVIAIPLVLDGKLHWSSVIAAVLLVCGIIVYNCWGAEKEANASITADDNQGMGSTTDDHGAGIKNNIRVEEVSIHVHR